MPLNDMTPFLDPAFPDRVVLEHDWGRKVRCRVSVPGVNKTFSVRLYKEQWLAYLERVEELKALKAPKTKAAKAKDTVEEPAAPKE